LFNHLLKLPGTFQMEEMAGIIKRLFYGTRNLFRNQPAVFGRNQFVQFCRENQGGDVYLMDAISGIEAGDGAKLPFEGIIRLKRRLQLPFLIPFEGS
jgi:hypothetical protein